MVKAETSQNPPAQVPRKSAAVRGKFYRLKRSRDGWSVEIARVLNGDVVEILETTPNVFPIIAEELIELAKADVP